MEHIRLLRDSTAPQPILHVKHEYLSLKNPTAEDRFRFQRRLAMTTENSAALLERQTDYGMELESPNIAFDDWKKRAEFSLASYPRQADTVSWRGARFKTGDVFLCNRARGSDGMFTTLVDGRQSFAHVAVYSLLESEGQFFPAVLEIHAQGIRAVPLKAYLSEAFSTYIEVYRSRTINESDRTKLSEVSLQMLIEPHGFDIYLDDSQDTYLTCAQTVAQLYRRAGLEPVIGKSRYSLKTQPNLEILGVTSCAGRDLLMPDDYSRCAELTLTGIIDNGKFIELIARALVRERMQKIWQTMCLDPATFTSRFTLNWFVIQAARLGIPGLSSFLKKKCGFSAESFPSGPATFMALTPIVEAQIEHAAALVAESLREWKSELMKATSWSEIAGTDSVTRLVTKAMSGFTELFQKDI